MIIINAINRYVPIFVKSIFVTYPNSANSPKIPAVIPNIYIIDEILYVINIDVANYRRKRLGSLTTKSENREGERR